MRCLNNWVTKKSVKKIINRFDSKSYQEGMNDCQVFPINENGAKNLLMHCMYLADLVNKEATNPNNKNENIPIVHFDFKELQSRICDIQFYVNNFEVIQRLYSKYQMIRKDTDTEDFVHDNVVEDLGAKDEIVTMFSVYHGKIIDIHQLNVSEKDIKDIIDCGFILEKIVLRQWEHIISSFSKKHFFLLMFLFRLANEESIYQKMYNEEVNDVSEEVTDIFLPRFALVNKTHSYCLGNKHNYIKVSISPIKDTDNTSDKN